MGAFLSQNIISIIFGIATVITSAIALRYKRLEHEQRIDRILDEGRRSGVRGSLLFGAIYFGILFYWILVALIWFTFWQPPLWLRMVFDVGLFVLLWRVARRVPRADARAPPRNPRHRRGGAGRGAGQPRQHHDPSVG